MSLRRMRWLVLVCGLVSAALSARALTTYAQSDADVYALPAECDAGMTCIPLFDLDQSRVEITRLDTLSNYPVFRSPLLEMEFTLKNVTPPFRIYLDQPYLIGNRNPDGSAPTNCELIVVGLANPEGEYLKTISWDHEADPYTVQLLAFCKAINLPNVGGTGQPFPTGSLLPYITNIQPLDDPRVNALMARALDESAPCQYRPQDLETQFAMWVLDGAKWEQFQVQAGNRRFERNKQCIYRLANLPMPDPTATHTPTPSATPPGTDAPSPTMVYLFQESVEIKLGDESSAWFSLEQIAVVMIGVILGIVIIAALVRAHPRIGALFIALLAVSVVAVIWFLNRNGSLPGTPVESTMERTAEITPEVTVERTPEITSEATVEATPEDVV